MRISVTIRPAIARRCRVGGAERRVKVMRELEWASPLGAAVGDWLDKPLDKGGLNFSRPLASAVLAVAILGLILLLPQRAGSHPSAKPA